MIVLPRAIFILLGCVVILLLILFDPRIGQDY